MALAGIQALYRLSLNKDREIAQIRKSEAAKDARIANLAAHNRKLTGEVEQLSRA